MGLITAFKDQAVRMAASELFDLAANTATTTYKTLAQEEFADVKGAELKRWITAIQDNPNLPGNKSFQRINAKIMEEIATKPTIQSKARDFRANESLKLTDNYNLDPPQDPPPTDLCRILHFDSTDAIQGSGTGFRLTHRLVLTCRHVLPDSIGTCKKVQLKFPVFNGKFKNTDVWIHLIKVYETTKEFNHARILVGSEGRGDVVETSKWDGNEINKPENALDFALLEINYDVKPKWEIHLSGTADDVDQVNIFSLITRTKSEIKPLFAPTTPFFADELDERPIELRLITDQLWYEESPGAINKVNPNVERVRYIQNGAVRGDSGAPLVEVSSDRATVVAIHQAGLKGKSGQAVPIGPILETIRDSSLDQGHKIELASFGWLPQL